MPRAEVPAIALIGIDGSGKSVLFQELTRHLAAQGLKVHGFSALQIFDDPALPGGDLSRLFDVLAGLGDTLQDASLKATAMFLGMTLFGPAVAHLKRVQALDYLVTERHPVIDSLVYARYYHARLASPTARDLQPEVDRHLAGLGLEPVAVWERIEQWVETLPALAGQSMGFWGLPAALHRLFALPPEALLAELETLFQTTLPARAVLLTLPVEVADARIAVRVRHQPQAGRDLHETLAGLELLQAAYHQTCAGLMRLRPEFRVLPIDALQGPEATLAATLRALPGGTLAS